MIVRHKKGFASLKGVNIWLLGIGSWTFFVGGETGPLILDRYTYRYHQRMFGGW